MKNINILLFAGCGEKKLISKISPILDTECVENIYLIRNSLITFSHPKLKQYYVPKIFTGILPLRELTRIIIGIYILMTKKVNIVMGIHIIMHCVYAYFLSKIFGKKYVFLIIESPQKYNGNKFLTKILKGASLIGVRGENSKKYLVEQGVPEDIFFCPPNEFEIPKIQELEKIYDVIYIGNFVEQKDLPLWVNTISKLKDTYPNIRAIMLGDGVLYHEIKNMIKDLELGKNIELVGRQSDVYGYIERSKVHLMTSKSEGFPMVAMESMSLGVPSVLPNVGDISDVVKNNENGFVVNSREPEDFAKNVQLLLEKKETYERISKNGLKTIKDMEKDMSHGSIVKLWEDNLKKVK